MTVLLCIRHTILLECAHGRVPVSRLNNCDNGTWQHGPRICQVETRVGPLVQAAMDVINDIYDHDIPVTNMMNNM